MTKEQIFYSILKSIAKEISFEDFCKAAKNFPFFYSKQLTDGKNYANVFGRNYFFILEELVLKWIGTDTKLEAYKKINNYLEGFLQFIKDDLTEEKINKHIQEMILSDCNKLNEQFPNASKLARKIHVINAKEKIFSLIEEEIKDRYQFYTAKIKSWINKEFEKREREIETDESQIFSLKELKDLNKVGEVFTVDESVIDEIDDAIKDKFIWIDGKYIDSSMGFGSNHAVMQKNYLRKRRGEQIDKFDKDYISNTRSPEDLTFNVTEEEANLPVAYGSFYFNGEVCIIEGKYKLNDYDALLQDLKKRFTHIFDLTLRGRKLKQEAKISYLK